MKELIEQLTVQSEKILTLANEITTMKFETMKIERVKEEGDAHILKEILADKESYPNEASRKAELAIRLETDDIAFKTTQQIIDNKKTIEMKENELGNEKRIFRIYEVKAELMSH